MRESRADELRRQVEQVARELPRLRGEGLATLLLATANALVRGAESVLAEDGDPLPSEDALASHLGLAQSLNDFYRRHEALAETAGEASLERLRKLEEDNRTLGAELAQLRERHEAALGENEALRARVDASQASLDELARERERLAELDAQCAPEVIERQRAANEALEAEMATRQGELAELRDQQAEAEAERDSLSREVAAIRNAIAAIPEESVTLREAYRALEQELHELEAAEEAYSDERRAALEEQVAALVKDVEAKRVAQEELSARLESLQRQETTYDQQRHQLRTNLVELINDSLGDLRRHLDDHEEFLQRTAATAKEVEERLARCQETYEGYRQWFDSTRTPLDAMAAAFEYPESQRLRETLDVGALASVRERMDAVETNLHALDAILSTCARAVGKDLLIVRNRAGD